MSCKLLAPGLNQAQYKNVSTPRVNRFGQYGYQGGAPIVVAINHPLADEVHFVSGVPDATSVTLSFFKDGTWVTGVVTEFEDFVGPVAVDTRTYLAVPPARLATFLSVYAS